MPDLVRAVSGQWWRSAKGAIYCVRGVGFGKAGRGASVELYWITGHVVPQIHRYAYPVTYGE